MANIIEVVIRAIDQASTVIAKIDASIIASNAALVKGFDDVGVAADTVDKKLSEYGAALTATARTENQLKQAQLEAVDAANKLAQAQENLKANTDPSKTEALNRELISAQVNLDKAGQEVQKLSQNLRDGKDATEQSARGFESFAGKLVAIQAGIGIAKEAISGLKEVWDFAKQGAENQRIAESFDRTAQSIGGNAADIVDQLDKAARGTVDDEELMQASTRALTLGVAQSSDDLVKVMKLARGAALQFGGDAGTAFENINQAIGNLAPRALKQYGIIVNLTEANTKYATAIGVSVDSLTEQQQRQALLNAVLEQGAKNFGDIGNSATTTAEKMKAVETRIGNIVDIVKELAATGFATAFNINDQPRMLLDAFTGTAAKMRKEVAAGRMSVKDYNDALQGMAGAMTAPGGITVAMADAALQTEKITESQAANLQSLYEWGRGVDTAILSTQRWTQEQIRATSVDWQHTESIDGAVLALRRHQQAIEDDAKSIKDATIRMADLKIAMGGAAQNEMKSYQDRQTDLKDQAKKLADQIAELERKQGSAAKTTVTHAMSANELALANVRLSESVQRLNKEEDPAKRAVLAAQIAVERDNLNQANTSVTKYVDNSKQIGDLKDQYAKVNDEIINNANQHDIATKRIVFGYLEQELAAQGMTVESTKALDTLAEKWGLLSKADIAALNDARIAAKTFAQDKSFDHLAASADAAIADAQKPAKTAEEAAKEASRATGGLSDLVKGQSDTINKSLNSTKQPSQDFVNGAKAMQNEFDTTRNKAISLVNYGFNPMSTVLSTLTQQVSIFSIALGKLPGVAALLPTYVPPRLPSNPEGRTNPLPGGAQHGADFVVPPGFPGDTFPLRVTSGERVQVTPVGQNRAPVSVGQSAQMPTINITQNFSGAQSSPEQYRAIVYDVMNDVIKTAMRQ